MKNLNSPLSDLDFKFAKRGASYSIGYVTQDEEFALLATINNHNCELSAEEFDATRDELVNLYLMLAPGREIIALPREDAEDTVTLEPEELAAIADSKWEPVDAE